MKILLIATSFLPRIGGRELYQDQVLTQFAPDEVVVLTPDRQGDYATFDKDYRFKVRRCSRLANDWFLRGRRAQAQWFWFLARLCFRERPDVVLCETVLPDGLSGRLLHRTLGKPYVVHAMGQDLARAAANEWARAQLSKLIASASQFIAISHFMGGFLIEQGAKREQVTVVLPGLNPGYSAQDDGRAESIRQRYGLRGKKVIVTVSRLVDRKGQDKVIEAMPEVLKAIPDAAYLVVGDGPDRARLEALSSQLGVERHVIFVGAVPYDEAPAFYSASDVFAMPNRERPGDFEGFGIVFLEANARGLPVIGGRSGGAQDAVADGESGYLVDPMNVSEIAQRLIELLGDRELARHMAEAGRLRVETQFSWDRAARQVRSAIAEAAVCSPVPVLTKIRQTAQTLLQPVAR